MCAATHAIVSSVARPRRIVMARLDRALLRHKLYVAIEGLEKPVATKNCRRSVATENSLL